LKPYYGKPALTTNLWQICDAVLLPAANFGIIGLDPPLRARHRPLFTDSPDRNTIASVPFAFVQGLVRHGDQSFGRYRIAAAPNRNADADCRRHRSCACVNCQIPHSIADAFANRQTSFFVDIVDDYQKLLASVTADDILRSYRRNDGTGDPSQHLITDLVAELVVHLLEIIDIGKTDAD
jgi:hypothetical protein